MDATDSLTQFRTRRRKRAVLGKALVQSIAVECAHRGWPRILWRLVGLCRTSTSAEVAALVWTAARWGELHTIDWSRCAEMKPALITMGKVGRDRPTPVPPLEVRPAWGRVEHPIVLPHQSRRTVAKSIRQNLRRIGLRPPKGVQSGTHAIRHLIASAMEWNGSSREEIARRLGHRGPGVTADYIHTKAAWQVA